MLTGMMASEGTPRYGCTSAYSVEGHGKRYVSERKVIGWVMDEAARLRTPELVEQERRIIDIPAIDWSREPRAVNRVLTAMWEYVELDHDLLPIRAEWRVPEWRMPTRMDARSTRQAVLKR